MLNARVSSALLLGLTSLQAVIAFQNWYHVRYAGSQSIRSLDMTGVTAYGSVSALLWLGLIGGLGALILRGWPRSAVLAVVSLGFGLCELALFGPVREGIPVTLGAQLEKATGISGSQPQDLDSIVQSITISWLSYVFLVVGLVGLVVCLLASFASARWIAPKVSDKYRTSKDGARAASAHSDVETDSIAIWDSQK